MNLGNDAVTSDLRLERPCRRRGGREFLATVELPRAGILRRATAATDLRVQRTDIGAFASEAQAPNGHP